MNTAIDIAIKVGTGALGGAAAALLLASWVAQRQEAGKARAAALVQVRSIVAEQIANSDYHHVRAKTKKSYLRDSLSLTHQARVACDITAAARATSRRTQRRIRAALVKVFGEITVRCAELLALTPFVSSHAVKDSETWAAAQLQVGLSLKPGQERPGSFEAFAADPANEAAHGQALADLRRLQKVVGGGALRLGARAKRR